ncbi:MAG: TIGR01777 family oxidoreductase, partial [Vicinamibacterales bacterium]
GTDGHDVTILTRQSSTMKVAPRVSSISWNPDGNSGPWAHSVNGAAAVINLAGESIAAKRWSPAQKQKLRDSRLLATRSLTAAIRDAARPPAVFISGSAVGYYGDRGGETITEASAPGTDFLAGLAKDWETAANDVAQMTRVALVRTGIVLDRRGGALPKMLPPFQMFVGGPLGSGTQYMPWIHKEDWVRLVSWIVATETARGPVNATSPSPVTNAEFSKALGRALKRPSLLPAPAFALRLALGEMADALLLSGQRALPARAADLGFSFRYSTIDEALASVLS